jgi:eukaryotic-like serine/threonine-protein kinase
MNGAETTIEYTPRTPAPEGDSFAPRRAVLEGSDPRLSAETQALLRVRLRAASLVLLVGFGLFFARDLLLSGRDRTIQVFHATLLAFLAASRAWLSGRRAVTLRRLRAIELAIFGLSALFFATVQYRHVLLHIRRDDVVGAVATIKGSVLFLFALMSLYGMFIPNHWRRAAMVVVPMALVPNVVMGVLRIGHPELKTFARRVATFEMVSDNQLMLLIGAMTAVYATHIINSLRTEAYEARRLGQYRLGKRLGSGGMGEVYLAEHQLLKRPCAIKLIRPGRAADPQALARFEREVRATARLSHPNTVEIYDYGRTEDGTFYYVMEYLPGLSLADLVDRHGPLPPGRAIYLLRQACQALREAHAMGLVHRDIKPANIFAARRGGLDDVAKLLDFGLVLQDSGPASPQLSLEGTVSGSPLYMSPEQAAGNRRPDRRGDIYSLGAVAYFLLTGRPPFPGETALAVMIAHARDAVAPPSQLRPGLPADLEAVVLRCLAKDPADRYRDADALDEALGSCRDAGSWTRDDAARWWHAAAGAVDPEPVMTDETVVSEP